MEFLLVIPQMEGTRKLNSENKAILIAMTIATLFIIGGGKQGIETWSLFS